MLAKNINSSDTFASIKFNINVEIREQETAKESHRGGQLQDAGEGVGGELQDAGEGVRGELQDAAGVGGQLQDTGEGVGGQLQDIGEGVGGQLQDGGELRDAGERVGGELQDAGEGGGGEGELQTSENESSDVPHVINQMESIELPHELLQELLQSSICQADFSELPQETNEYAQETKEFVCQTDSSELRKSKMKSKLVESLFSPFIEDIKTYFKENSLPPFVAMKLELQDGNNEVECKMLAKNINSSDTYVSIKFNINVEVEKEEQTKESHGEGELKDVGEGVGEELQNIGGEGEEFQDVGKGGGGELQDVGEGVGEELQDAGGMGGELHDAGEGVELHDAGEGGAEELQDDGEGGGGEELQDAEEGVGGELQDTGEGGGKALQDAGEGVGGEPQAVGGGGGGERDEPPTKKAEVEESDKVSPPVLVTTRAQAARPQPADSTVTAVPQDPQNLPPNLTKLEFRLSEEGVDGRTLRPEKKLLSGTSMAVGVDVEL
ncbi:golgin subfamily A member 6-like protein 2 [Procambarus clarkii]|uniref:golgin subfamily A member 6-like protein 2 n=1 Tax=Procambarus clarkii TaxID=6728 RepID=UPI0037442138